MAKLEPFYANSFDSMESRKRKGSRVPLPYLIRPRRKLPIYDSFCLYNDYVEDSSIKDESDEDDSPMDAVVETSSLEKGNCFGLQTESNASLSEGNCFGLKNESNASLSEMDESSDCSDEEYVLVRNAKPEKEGTIQMMEISRDLPVSPYANDRGADESGSDDAGSSSDEWVVV